MAGGDRDETGRRQADTDRHREDPQVEPVDEPPRLRQHQGVGQGAGHVEADRRKFSVPVLRNENCIE